MALFEGKTPSERNKMIAGIVLPLLALIFVVRMFSGPSGPTKQTNANIRGPRAAKGPRQPQQSNPTTQPDAVEVPPEWILPIDCCPQFAGGADAGRNIFAFYVPPRRPVATVAEAPPPTPTPPPPLTLTSLAPQSVFARTAGFTLQVSGDKFGPAARVYVDGQELPTQYRSMQQLTANVSAALIASHGQHQVQVRTPDGTLYSNTQQITVMQPPAPTYTYIGFLKRPRSNTAVVKDAKGELYSVRDGDLVEGRFRVLEISERGIEVVDKDLNIKHTMPFVSGSGSMMGRVPGSIQPPPPPSEDGDEEP